MEQADRSWRRVTEDGVRDDVQRQPHVLLQLAENTLSVAESLRDNYFRNTAKFVATLRRAMHDPARTDPLLRVRQVTDASWPELQGEVVTFIDGGLGRVQIASQAPILLRVGSYCVRVGERRIAEREQFGYYPVILGDLEGGNKARQDFPDIVRITAELLGGLVALERTPDLRLLLFHGPLMYPVGAHAGHTPFTERDVDLLLRHYASQAEVGETLKADFLREAELDVYPRMTDRSDEWVGRRLFEPLAFVAYLYRRLIRTASERTPAALIAGVVERGERLREFSETVLLERVFRSLRAKGNADYFTRLYGRADLTNPTALLDRLGYTDPLLLAMLLDPGEFTEPWIMRKAHDLHPRHSVALPGEAGTGSVDFSPLRSGPFSFPRILGSYLQVSETTEPVRLEVFADLGAEQVAAVARRVYLYARLLPGYGFPVGLDIADKYARVPAWLMDAYGKTIRHHLGVSLQRGEVSDAEMRRLIVQALYIKNRDWLFRPTQ